MSLVVHVIAPTGRDAELITSLLQQNHIAAEACVDPAPLLAGAQLHPLGPLLIAEEALQPRFVTALAAVIQDQPTWSDLPILILTSSGRETADSRRREVERLPLGLTVLLERPIRTASLLSSIRTALRARQRQYQIRDAFLERDHAYAEQNKERETLQVVLDNLPIGVLLAQADGAIVLGNQAVTNILRHPILDTPDVAAHGRWISYHADGSRVRGEDYPLPRAMQQGRTIQPEDYLYQRGDGTLAWVRLAAAPILDSARKVIGGVVAVSDIDQQKRAEHDLRRSEERFRRLIENTSIGVNIGDFDGTLRYMNPALLKLTGYTAEEVEQGRVTWSSLTPPEYAEADRKALQQLQTRGTADPYRKEYLTRAGTRIPLLLSATIIPSQADSGRPDEIAVFLTDLTSQKQTEAALIQSEKLAAVGRLAASISHEINNPLESITNLLYLARASQNLPEVQSYLETADIELARVSQIVAQTLRFHRQATRPRAVTPDELLDPAIALYQGRLANAHIKLTLQKRGASAITCYEGDLRQVLNNLIGNALDATRGGGHLVIRTSNACLWRSGAKGVRITIADSGQGMPPEVSKRIFEAFYTTKGINGTGLGLWISHGIIEKHAGRIQVRSHTDGIRTGTTFSLFLPDTK